MQKGFCWALVVGKWKLTHAKAGCPRPKTDRALYVKKMYICGLKK